MNRRVSIWAGLCAVVAAATFLATNSFAIAVPRKSPEFVVHLEDGRQLLLSKYRGKVVALGIILTTCPHCQDMCKVMNKLYLEYREQGFQPLVAAINQEADISAFAKVLGLRFPVGTTPRPQAYGYLQEEFRYVPQLVIVDRSGTIRAQHGGIDDFFKQDEQNIRALVVSLLREPAK